MPNPTRKHRFLKFLAKAPYKAFSTKGGRLGLYTAGVLGGSIYLGRRFREKVSQRWEDPLKYHIYQQGEDIKKRLEPPSAPRPRGFQRRYFPDQYGR